MIYRTEHPNPQFERANWLCLNGEWEFETDAGVSGEARGMYRNAAAYSRKINVPFCLESKLSGIAETDFINSVWYRRHLYVEAQALQGKVFLNFGACDYKTTVYINEKKVGTHIGGFSSFRFDITPYLEAGNNSIAVNAVDDTRSGEIPSGKQSDLYESYGCFYTRTTGIWQSVWAEFVPKTHIKHVKYFTDIENAVLTIEAELEGPGELKAEAYFGGYAVGTGRASSKGGHTLLSFPLTQKHLWKVGEGNLYDLVLTYGEDTVKSYFGLRSVSVSGNKILINGETVFQRLILDQGFYPEGLYTAPTDGDLVGDIQRAMDMGFHGARLHQKVFEQRFLYHCDRLGYIVWGEFPSWGLDHTLKNSIYGILPEWLEVVQRDFNHPSIITWCPFNETWELNARTQCDDLITTVYRATKAADPTRPCVDTSGGYHRETDIYDIHDYEQNYLELKRHYDPLLDETPDFFDFRFSFKQRQQYDGKKPVHVSEYGGTAWANTQGWGYGDAPKTESEFLERFQKRTEVLLNNKNICGFCYTQLTDIEQEQNGLYYYDRSPKFDPAVIRESVTKKAAIEE